MAVAKVEIKGAYLDSGVAKTLARGQNINRAFGNSI